MTSGGPGPRSGGFLLGGETPSERTGDSGFGRRTVWAGQSWAARLGERHHVRVLGIPPWDPCGSGHPAGGRGPESTTQQVRGQDKKEGCLPRGGRKPGPQVGVEA